MPKAWNEHNSPSGKPMKFPELEILTHEEMNRIERRQKRSKYHIKIFWSQAREKRLCVRHKQAVLFSDSLMA
jgi:hypothetical protein